MSPIQLRNFKFMSEVIDLLSIESILNAKSVFNFLIAAINNWVEFWDSLKGCDDAHLKRIMQCITHPSQEKPNGLIQ